MGTVPTAAETVRAEAEAKRLTQRQMTTLQPKLAELYLILHRAADILSQVGEENLRIMEDQGRVGLDEIRAICDEDIIRESARSVGMVMTLNRLAVPAVEGVESDAPGVAALRRIQAAAEAIRLEVDAQSPAIKAACKAARQDESSIHRLLEEDGYSEIVDLQAACANVIHRHGLIAPGAVTKLARKGRAV